MPRTTSPNEENLPSSTQGKGIGKEINISPAETPSQIDIETLESREVTPSTTSTASKTKNQWMWEYYNVTELSTSWSDKRKRLRRDRRIDCFQPNCNWTTSDSRRMSNTSNLVGHLAKHNIFAPSVSVEQAPTQTLEKLWFKHRNCLCKKSWSKTS